VTGFDGDEFARAWLSVALASGNDKDLVQLHKTVAIEEYPTGVRLVSTDRFILLTAWVPSTDAGSAEPLLDEVPDRTVIARDADGRGKSLLSYVLKLVRREREDYPDAEIPLTLTFDARLPAGHPGGDDALDGMEPTYVVLEVPDTERVYLETVAMVSYPSWRALVDGFSAETTKVVSFATDRLHRLGKVGAYHDGPIDWTFGGAERAAFIEVRDSNPHVQGVVMPVRWHTELDPEPADETESTESEEAGS
jgi:hypothetical protein